MIGKFLDRVPFLSRKRGGPIVAVLRLSGPIGMPLAIGRSLSLASLAGPIEQAFSIKSVKAVALVINSPGGSAVQSTLIHDRIRALAEEKSVPVFAFAEDVAASGGYMLALAGDEIYADASSIVGSIGVIAAGFGFTELLEKLGIERRIHTAGGSKSMLDAFRPEDPEDVKRLRALQDEIHVTFIDLVKKRRGDLLTGSDDHLFTGEFWTGVTARKLGLIDGIGNVRAVMRSRYGEKVKLRLIGGPSPWWRRRSLLREGAAGFGGLPGSFWADDLINAVEQRSLWARFGL
jgi:signal peptide peptidase SppA